MKKLITALTAALLLLSASGVTLSASVDLPNVQFYTQNFNRNVRPMGLTAAESLGKPTGTLEEFAAAGAAIDDRWAYVTFPVNDFRTYGGGGTEIIGGIYSQGEVLVDGRMDWACGFDSVNRFYLFSLSGSAEDGNGKIIIKDASGDDVEIVTAFNCYPWLIKDGEPLDLSSLPGAGTELFDRPERRAFMGQTSYWPFIYGIAENATMAELQEICAELDLVNAVCTVGGGLAGIYYNGQDYGAIQELASVAYIYEKSPVEYPPVTVIYNGAKIEFSQPVVRDGCVFYPLDEVFQAFCGEYGAIESTGDAYGKLNGNAVEVPLSDPGYIINGERLNAHRELPPFVLNGRTYVYLDYIVQGLGLSVEWNGAERAIYVSD
jgi:hypothetical protein